MLTYYIKLYKYIHFLLLYLQFCDHSKRILTDWITQWKKALPLKQQLLYYLRWYCTPCTTVFLAQLSCALRYKKEISSHDLRCACGILKSWDVFISMRLGRAWKKRARRTATASLPLWVRIPRVYIWNNELKRAKDAICERPLKTPVLSVCIVLVIFSASFFFCPLFAAVFPRSDFFLLSNECVLKCSEVQYFPQNILK